MSKAREIASSENVSGFKNLIINGGFDIWQRGESFTDMTDWNYTADMFKVYGVSDVSRLDDGRLYLLSSNTDTDHVISQPIESGDKLRGKTLTMQVDIEWLQGADCSLQLTWRDSDLVWINSHIERLDSLMVIGERKVITMTVDIPDDSNIEYLDYRVVTNTDSDTLELKLANAQLELGDTATPFEQRPIGLELSLCQRYYQVMENILSIAISTSRINCSYFHSVTPRTLPSYTFYSKNGTIGDTSVYNDIYTDIGASLLATTSVQSLNGLLFITDDNSKLTSGTYYSISYTADASI